MLKSNPKQRLSDLRKQAGSVLADETRPPTLSSVSGFFASGLYSLRFILCEKENLIFSLLQWSSIALMYFVWVQALDWIPDEIWENSQNSSDSNLADIILLIWSFVCVGLAAYPIGLLTACMSASFLLRFQGRPSTIANCFKTVSHHAGILWTFSWLDGWWTVNRILERLPKKNDRTPTSTKIRNELLYQGWKMASLGFMPAILSGRGLKNACGDSLNLMTKRFIPLAKLRFGYSFICWIIGIGCYVSIIFLFPRLTTHMRSDNDMFNFYVYAGFPMVVALAIVILIVRPLYIISATRLYAMFARDHGIKIDLPEAAPKLVSSIIFFIALAVIAGTALIYNEELGIKELLSKIN